MEDLHFHWADYAVFAASLVLSAGVGVYFGVTGKRQQDTEEFLMAGRSMNPVPVSVSLFVSWLSAVSVLGDPVEAYTYGAVYWIAMVGFTLSLPIAAHFFAPYFHKLRIVSAYEFLETKYNKVLRCFATVTNILTTALWLGIVVFGPALALSQSSGIPVWIALISITLVCIFYTALGGMKAVLWTDTLQMLIMVAGQLAIVIQGILRIGGINKMFHILAETGHSKIDNFDPSPYARATFWTFLIGSFFRTLNPYISTQMQIQRYSTVKTSKQASLAVYLNIPMFVCMVTLFTATGFIMAVLYRGCDPLMQGQISHKNQMVPLLVLELLGFLPGIPGLFMASVFSAALSSMSSGINSMAAVTLKDFIEPAVMNVRKQNLSDKSATIIAKLLVVVYGGIALALSFGMMATGSSIFFLASQATGMAGSPLAGVFFVGVIFPSIKTRSVIPAFLIALTICLWWGVGAFFLPPQSPREALPVSLDNCSSINNTLEGITGYHTTFLDSTNMSSFITTETIGSNGFTVSDLYYLNPLYFGALGFILTVLLSLLFHWCTLLYQKLVKKNNDYVVNGKTKERSAVEMQQKQVQKLSEGSVNDAFDANAKYGSLHISSI